jgi:cytochrome c-type biogenesis protein CcmH
MIRAGLVLAAALLMFAVACDRRVEPYVEEEPHQPDLSRIFPEGAEEAAREAAQRGPVMPPPPPGQAQGQVASGPPIRGTVSVSPELADKVRGDSMLFVIARAGTAGPPLAVKRVPSPEFPLAFEIGPDDRMIKAMPFTGSLMLTARLDRDGNATTRTPGDLQGTAEGRVEPGAEGVEVVLDELL